MQCLRIHRRHLRTRQPVIRVKAVAQHIPQCSAHLLVRAKDAGTAVCVALFMINDGIAKLRVHTVPRDFSREVRGKQARPPSPADAHGDSCVRVHDRHLLIADLQPLSRADRTDADDIVKRNFHHARRAVAQTFLQDQRLFLERIGTSGDRFAHEAEQRHNRIQIKRDIQQPDARRGNQQIAENLRNRQSEQNRGDAEQKALARHRTRRIDLLKTYFFHRLFLRCGVSRPAVRLLP